MKLPQNDYSSLTFILSDTRITSTYISSFLSVVCHEEVTCDMEWDVGLCKHEQKLFLISVSSAKLKSHNIA